jgi:hypothetical protein
MAYTRHKPPPAESSDQLRARIPGWGVDLDPQDRPSVPKLDLREDLTGAHWDFPDRQPEGSQRERSVEHAFLTPVFGTAQPTRGLSGALRRLSYARYSEARTAHWLLLIAADRVDAVESHLLSLLTLRPDNPVTQTGVKAELSHHGIASRLRRGRTDVPHQLIDPVIVTGPWVLAGLAGFAAVRAVARFLRR